MEFLSLSRRRSSARNVPSSEEGGETDVFTGYKTRNIAQVLFFCILARYLYWLVLARLGFVTELEWKLGRGRFWQVRYTVSSSLLIKKLGGWENTPDELPNPLLTYRFTVNSVAEWSALRSRDPASQFEARSEQNSTRAENWLNYTESEPQTLSCSLEFQPSRRVANSWGKRLNSDRDRFTVQRALIFQIAVFLPGQCSFWHDTSW